MFFKSLVLAGPLLLAASIASQAALTTYNGTFQLVEGGNIDPSQISTDDVFFYQFTVDTAVTDVDAETNHSRFDNIVTSWIFGKVSGPGTWDPSASGTWTVGADTYADFGQWRFNVQGSGLEPLNSDGEFATTVQLWMNFDLPLSDTGAGQTFEELVGDLEPASVGVAVSSGFTGSSDAENLTFAQGVSPYAVPEASCSLLVLGSAMAGVLRRKRKQG